MHRTLLHIPAFLLFATPCGAQPPTPTKEPVIHLVCPAPTAHKESEMHAVTIRVNGIVVYACNDVSLQQFKKDPAPFINGELKDPVSGKPFTVTEKTPKVERKGDLYLFGSAGTKAAFLKDPGKYLKPPKQ